MIWPPVKAWTSSIPIDGQVHFVALNYSCELPNKWVVLMSVLDSNVVVKVSWSQLVDGSNWKTGWDEMNYVESSELVNTESYVKTSDFLHPSHDSGLTIPISKKSIRPWFDNQ